METLLGLLVVDSEGLRDREAVGFGGDGVFAWSGGDKVEGSTAGVVGG